MKSLFILALLCFINISCTQTIEQTNKSISGEIQSPLHETLTGTGNKFYPIFHSTGTKIIHTQHQAGETTKISFINDLGKSISIDVSFPKTSSGNLRLSQIIMPDGTMDGPFGQYTKYNLIQKGGYELIFHENIMAGDPWSGEVEITLTLSDSFVTENMTTLP